MKYSEILKYRMGQRLMVVSNGDVTRCIAPDLTLAENDSLRYMRVLFACPKQPRITRLTVVGQKFLKQVGLAVTKLLILGAWYS